MELIYDLANEDIVKMVHIECSPVEWLTMNMALKRTYEDDSCLEEDKKTIKTMIDVEPIVRKVIEKE
jgi:hypothetical protein